MITLMRRKLIGIILVLMQIVGLFCCQIAPHPNKSPMMPVDNSAIHTQKPETPIDKKSSLPIQLAIASFDPLISKGPAFPSPELSLQHYPEDTIGYYIVQFKGPVLQEWKDDVVAAGALFFDYIPRFAFLVKMSYNTYNKVQTMGPVRWVGIYQPGYRISPELLAGISAYENHHVEVLVSIFAEENVSDLVAEIRHLEGKILSLSETNEKLTLEIPHNKLVDLSRLNGIKYIETIPKFKLSPGIQSTGGKP
jgi:hypothetical protein